MIRLDARSGAAYAALGLVEHQLGNYQESISRYHEVRLTVPLSNDRVDVPTRQALSISPGDPVTCDLLKLVLEDTAHNISTEQFPFPGIPPAKLRAIDQQVAELDASIAAGEEPADDGSEGGDGEETMDMSG